MRGSVPYTLFMGRYVQNVWLNCSWKDICLFPPTKCRLLKLQSLLNRIYLKLKNNYKNFALLPMYVMNFSRVLLLREVFA